MALLRFGARWPWPRVGLLAVIALAMWGLKRHYAMAEVGELCWILKPVASLSALTSGVQFEWEPGSGYLSRERLFVIAKPCAGVNFMLAALGMVGFLLSERALRRYERAMAHWHGGGIRRTGSRTRSHSRPLGARHPIASELWTAAIVHGEERSSTSARGSSLWCARLAKTCERLMEALHWGCVPLAFILRTIAIHSPTDSGDQAAFFRAHGVVVLHPDVSRNPDAAAPAGKYGASAGLAASRHPPKIANR